MNPAEKLAETPPENSPKRKRGRPRKERTPKPKRPRGRPSGLRSDVLDTLFEFIFSLSEAGHGGRKSQKRALRAAAARVKIPLPVSGEVPHGFARFEECAAFAVREMPTRYLTNEEQKRCVDSAGRFFKEEKASFRQKTIIPYDGYRLCAGCGEVMGIGEPCIIERVIKQGNCTPENVYIHPKSEEHPGCVTSWLRGARAQRIGRLCLAAQLTPDDGHRGVFSLAQIDVPEVRTETRGRSGIDESRRKRIENWVKGEVEKLFPEEDEQLSYRSEYGLDLAALQDEYGGNARIRGAEGLSGIEKDEQSLDGQSPKLRQVAVGKNHIEDEFIDKYDQGILGADAEERRQILAKDRKADLPYRVAPPENTPTEGTAYLERLATEKERNESDEDGQRLDDLVQALSCMRLGFGKNEEKFRSKVRGSYYERDARGHEGETPLYDDRKPYAPPYARATRSTFETYLLETASHYEFETWILNDTQFDRIAMKAIKQAAEFAVARWKHKKGKRTKLGKVFPMVREVDGTPVHGGQKPASLETLKRRQAKDWVLVDYLAMPSARAAEREAMRAALPKHFRVMPSPPRPDDSAAHLIGSAEHSIAKEVRHSVLVLLWRDGNRTADHVIVEGRACRMVSPPESRCLYCSGCAGEELNDVFFTFAHGGDAVALTLGNIRGFNSLTL